MVFCGKESEEGFACLKKGIGAGIMIAKQRKSKSKKVTKKKSQVIVPKKVSPLKKKAPVTLRIKDLTPSGKEKLKKLRTGKNMTYLTPQGALDLGFKFLAADLK